MGFDYVYLNDGNDVEKLIATFKSVKDTKHPVVVHINTLKGHGYKFAEQDKETFHWEMPFDLATGKPKVSYDGENYSDLTAEYLLSEMKKHPEIVGITAGTPTVFGFTPERRKKAGKQFVDVGIAEEHAVALASGIATNGGKPVFGVFSTFIQRAYDQLSQDLAINNSPAVTSYSSARIYLDERRYSFVLLRYSFNLQYTKYRISRPNLQRRVLRYAQLEYAAA